MLIMLPGGSNAREVREAPNLPWLSSQHCLCSDYAVSCQWQVGTDCNPFQGTGPEIELLESPKKAEPEKWIDRQPDKPKELAKCLCRSDSNLLDAVATALLRPSHHRTSSRPGEQRRTAQIRERCNLHSIAVG